MPRHQILLLLGQLTYLLFVLALGASIGSLINVLVYRIPQGLNVVVPASRCPRCGTKLAWNDNIPILGWILLRGRCRYCRVPISSEYPIVEAIVAVLFASIFFLWFQAPELARWGHEVVWLGVDWSAAAPDWAAGGLRYAWPIFATVLVLLGCLVASTIIDARTFTIPLVLTWVPAAMGVAVHLLVGAWWARGGGVGWRVAEGWSYAIASPGPYGWAWVGAALGGVLGLGVSLTLMRLGLIGRSFDDFDEWERRARAEAGLPAVDEGDASAATPEAADAGDLERRESRADAGEGSEEAKAAGAGAALPPRPKRRGGIALYPVAMLTLAAGLGLLFWLREWVTALGVGLGLAAGPILAAPLRRALFPPRVREAASSKEVWLAYPHARREMVRELAFLAAPAALAMLGAWLAVRLAGPWSFDEPRLAMAPAVAVPLWLDALSGALLGYLIGGGVVWAVRIFGSLAFGKEAMGLGDVHLMAAVGACLGWIDPTLAFFLAAFVALYIELVGRLDSGGFRRALPFGPSLAVASVLVLVGKPAIEWAMSSWLSAPGMPMRIDLP